MLIDIDKHKIRESNASEKFVEQGIGYGSRCHHMHYQKVEQSIIIVHKLQLCVSTFSTTPIKKNNFTCLYFILTV